MEKRFSKSPIANHKILQPYVLAPPPPYLGLELKKVIVQSPPPSWEIKITALSHKNWDQFKSTFLKTHTSHFEKKKVFFQTDIILQISVAGWRIVASFFWRVFKLGAEKLRITSGQTFLAMNYLISYLQFLFFKNTSLWYTVTIWSSQELKNSL